VSYASAAAKVDASGEEEKQDWASYGLSDIAAKPWCNMCDWFPIKKHVIGLHRDLPVKLYSIFSMPVCDKQALVECHLYRQKHWETRQSIKLLSGDVFCHSVSNSTYWAAWGTSSTIELLN
jgi:hypothetical protein